MEKRVRKDEVRRLARTRLARTLRVPSADKPAWPCLAARIPYGTAVDLAIPLSLTRHRCTIASSREDYRLPRSRRA